MLLVIFACQSRVEPNEDPEGGGGCAEAMCVININATGSVILCGVPFSGGSDGNCVCGSIEKVGKNVGSSEAICIFDNSSLTFFIRNPSLAPVTVTITRLLHWANARHIQPQKARKRLKKYYF